MPSNNLAAAQKIFNEAEQSMIQAENALNAAQEQSKQERLISHQQLLEQAKVNFKNATDELNEIANNSARFLANQIAILNNLISESTRLVNESSNKDSLETSSVQRINEITTIINTVNNLLKNKFVSDDAYDLLDTEKSKYHFFDKKSNRIITGIAFAAAALLIIGVLGSIIILTAGLAPGNPGLLVPFMLLEFTVMFFVLGALWEIMSNQSFINHKPSSLAYLINECSMLYSDAQSSVPVGPIDTDLSASASSTQ